MEKNDIYKMIESLNIDYREVKDSKEYKLGRGILSLLRQIRHFRFIAFAKEARSLYGNYYVLQGKKFRTQAKIDPPVVIHELVQAKVVVYACIAGPYELPKEPFFPEENVDYILYTDQPKKNRDSVWEYRDIPDHVLKISKSGKVRNEYIRTHPHEFFPEYDYAIYVDGSLRIMSDASSWVSLVSPRVGIAMHKRGNITCVYKEGQGNLYMKRGNPKNIRVQMKYYRNEGMPENFGVLESPVIVTDLSHPTAIQIYNLWWEDFLRWNSQRDQMSLPFVLWKMGISVDDVGTLGGSVWGNPKLQFYRHDMKKYHVDNQ